MIETIELSCRLDHHNLLDILDHTNYRGITAWVSTDTAYLAVTDVVTDLAILDVLTEFDDTLSKAQGSVGFLSEQMQDKPQSGLLPHPWQFCEFLDCIFK